MRRSPKAPERERRITYEIVVDAYGPEERAMGWFCYLENHLHFPFRAKCIKARPISPLRKGEEVTVVGMPPEDYFPGDMFVLIEWGERTFGVPLAQLEGINVDKETKQAVADWHYWVAQGYQF
jgi:hypothetical protein